MNKKDCMLLTELKAFQNFLPVEKQAEFYEKLDSLQEKLEKQAEFYEKLDSLQEKLEKQENSFSFNAKNIFLIVITANFLLFPILNFIMKMIIQ